MADIYDSDLITELLNEVGTEKELGARLELYYLEKHNNGHYCTEELSMEAFTFRMDILDIIKKYDKRDLCK